MPETLIVGDLTFLVQRSKRRKTVSIIVDRGGGAVIRAPHDCSAQQLRQIAEEKQVWVYTKLAEKEELTHPPQAREYVTGEGFYYLGKSYRLRVLDPDPAEAYMPPLRFFRGRFLLRRDERPRARRHFVDWYTIHAKTWIVKHVEQWRSPLGVQPRDVSISDLGYRWGSCGTAKILNFHWRTIMLPPRIAEYVIVHEMVHLLEADHSADFWERLGYAVPDYQAHKQWLAENGAIYQL